MRAKMTLEQLRRIELMGHVCSTDTARPVVTAQYWHEAADEIGLTIAGTDSYKLAQTTLDGIECEGEALVPAVDVTKASQLFAWSARRHHGARVSYTMFDVDLFTSEGWALLTLRVGTSRLASLRVRLIDGIYPKYQKLITDAQERTFDDEPKVALNPRHLTDLMKTVPNADSYYVHLEFKGTLNPVLAKSPGDKRWTGLIMPVRA